jgi:hypothetical protein
MPINTTPNPDLARLTVRPLARADAVRIVKAKHYMRTFPQGSRVHLAVMDGRRAVGVVVLGYATHTAAKVERLVGRKLKRREYLEMQRLWVSDAYGHSTESYVLARVMRLLRKEGVRLVVTHAGGCKNDCGFVYQASAWLYFGRERCRDFYQLETGEFRNMVAAMRFGRVKVKGKTPQQIGEELFGPGQLVDSWRYLYAYPIDRGLRRRLTPTAQPYPKESAIYRYDQEWVMRGG